MERITDFEYFTLCAKSAQYREDLAVIGEGGFPSRYPALDERQKEQAIALLQEIARLAAGRMIELPQCPALRDRIQALETLLGFAEPEEDPYL